MVPDNAKRHSTIRSNACQFGSDTRQCEGTLDNTMRRLAIRKRHLTMRSDTRQYDAALDNAKWTQHWEVGLDNTNVYFLYHCVLTDAFPLILGPTEEKNKGSWALHFMFEECFKLRRNKIDDMITYFSMKVQGVSRRDSGAWLTYIWFCLLLIFGLLNNDKVIYLSMRSWTKTDPLIVLQQHNIIAFIYFCCKRRYKSMFTKTQDPP